MAPPRDRGPEPRDPAPPGRSSAPSPDAGHRAIARLAERLDRAERIAGLDGVRVRALARRLVRARLRLELDRESS